MPTAPATFSVPARRWRSCDPPCCWARMWVPRRIHSAPTPFGPSALCAASATRSAPSVVDVEVDPRRGLDGVHVEQHPAVRADDLRDVGDRLERPDLVVREHHGHERRALGDRARRCRPGRRARSGRPAPATTSNPNFSRYARAWPTAWCSTALVTIRCAAGLAGPRGALEREVVRLGAAAREHDLARVRADRPGEPLVRVVERLARGPPERVRRRRVAEHAARGTAASPRGPRGGAGVVAAWSR